MKESAEVSFDADAGPQQPGNRFQTGSDLKESATYLLEIMDDWEERYGSVRSHGLRLLKALCALVERLPEQAQTGYTAYELAVEVERDGGPDWYHDSRREPDTAEAGRKVSGYWKTANEIWGERQEGVFQRFADRQPVVIPDYGKDESKGGPPSRYWLRFEYPLSGVDASPEALPPPLTWSDLARRSEIETLTVRYYSDTATRRRILERLAESGILLNGVRRVIYFSVAIPVALFILAATALPILSLSYAADMQAVVKTGISLIMVVAAVWASLGWFVRVVENRIAIAPWPFQDWSGHDDRVIELRRDEDHDANRVFVRRYIAVCPLCQRKVRIQPGGRQFPRRLVGRCEGAPTEHVFSFDPILRTGVYLHWPHPYGKHQRPEC